MTKYDFKPEAGYFNTDSAMTDEQLQKEIEQYLSTGKTIEEARNLQAQNATRSLGTQLDIP
jgi:hypothetical protein